MFHFLRGMYKQEWNGVILTGKTNFIQVVTCSCHRTNPPEQIHAFGIVWYLWNMSVRRPFLTWVGDTGKAQNGDPDCWGNVAQKGIFKDEKIKPEMGGERPWRWPVCGRVPMSSVAKYRCTTRISTPTPFSLVPKMPGLSHMSAISKPYDCVRSVKTGTLASITISAIH